MTSRDILLSRVRAALRMPPPDADDSIDRRYRRRAEDPRETLVAQFAERVAEYRATVRWIAAGELSGAVAEACRRGGVRSLVVPSDIPAAWLPGDVEILRDAPEALLTNAQLDRSDGVLTGCAAGIAQTGTIVLDAGPRQGRRAISLLPDYHLCVVFEDQIVGLVPEAIALVGDVVRQSGRPSTFVSGPSATSDIELSRVEGVHGPRTLEVLLVQETLPADEQIRHDD
jgi:L-lactate dehydrogenase complex protein LldG